MALVGRNLDQLDSNLNLLAVQGTVQATSFQITNGLITPYLNISNLIYVDNGAVGIGTDALDFELEVIGSIKAENINVGQLVGDTFALATINLL